MVTQGKAAWLDLEVTDKRPILILHINRDSAVHDFRACCLWNHFELSSQCWRTTQKKRCRGEKSLMSKSSSPSSISITFTCSPNKIQRWFLPEDTQKITIYQLCGIQTADISESKEETMEQVMISLQQRGAHDKTQEETRLDHNPGTMVDYNG